MYGPKNEPRARKTFADKNQRMVNSPSKKDLNSYTKGHGKYNKYNNLFTEDSLKLLIDTNKGNKSSHKG